MTIARTHRETLCALVALAAAAIVLGGCAPALHNEDLIPSGVSASEVSAVARAQRATAYFNQGRYVDSVFLYHLVLRSNPRARNIRISLASSYERLGMPEEALVLYEDLLKLAPDDAALLAGKARILVRAERFKEAQNTYIAALGEFLKRGEPGAAADQAQSLSALAFRLGDEEAALCYAHQALTLKPSRALSLRLVRLLFSAGRTAEARKLLSAIAEEPGAGNDPLVLFALAQSAFENGALADALAYTERSLHTKLPDAADTQEIELFRKIVQSKLPRADDLEDLDEGVEDLQSTRTVALSRGIYWPASAQVDAFALYAASE